MKKLNKTIVSLALAAVCVVSAAACATKSNLKKEGWEEIIDSTRLLNRYQVMRTTIVPGEDLISETYSADYSAQTLKYNKVGNESGTLADKEIKIDEAGSVKLRDGFGAEWVDVTDSEAEEEAERTHAYNDFGTEHDLRGKFFNILYYPVGAEDYVEIKELYGYLKYSSGYWVADMDFVMEDVRYSGSVSVQMPDNIESARQTLSSLGNLLSLSLNAVVEGVEHEWHYTVYVGWILS